MAVTKVPTDLSASNEETLALSYWRGHMDARMEDLGRRVENIESKVTTIHESVQKIVVSLESRDATERQTKGFLRWVMPDSLAVIAICGAIVAIILNLVP
jgi:hypothetical protein